MQRTLFDADLLPKLSRKSDKATSHAAAAEVIPKLNATQEACLRAIDSSKLYPLTANEIAREAAARFGGIAESYRKRVHELVRAGMLCEAGKRKCYVTGKGATCYERVRWHPAARHRLRRGTVPRLSRWVPVLRQGLTHGPPQDIANGTRRQASKKQPADRRRLPDPRRRRSDWAAVDHGTLEATLHDRMDRGRRVLSNPQVDT